MMKSHSLSIVAVLLTLTSALPQILPICIVGAGPAGLTAAKKLEDKGRKVVIFERQVTVGGKCQAVYADNTFHPLGALLFSNASYPETLKVIATSGVTSVPLQTGQRWLFDAQSGGVTQAPAITSAFSTLVGQEFQRYAQYWTTIFAPYSALRYKDGVPQELTVTTSQWLARNNFQALPVLFVQAMVAFGYGDLREVPILYMLQYLTPDILGFFAFFHGVELIDFHKVWVDWTKKSITGPIYLGSTITKIDRSGPLPVIIYKKSDQYGHGPILPQTQVCSSVILAFPPTIPALQAAKVVLTPAETTVFSPLRLIPYFSGAVRLQAPRNLGFSAASPPNIPVAATGAPVSLLTLFNTSNIATTWSWGNNSTTTPVALQLLKDTLSKINKDPRDPAVVGKPVIDKDILGFQQNDYFPHFGPQELAGGWYEKFNKLQGAKNTYYASGLNGFETVEFAIRAGIEIVEAFF